MIAEEGHQLSLEFPGPDSRVAMAVCGSLVRSYLIKCERFLLVYDTLLGPVSGGWLREQALAMAEGLPLLVVNSHADWDHYFGNQCFPEPILGSRLCARRILGEPGRKELAQKRSECKDYEAVRPVPPAIRMESNGELAGGDLSFKVLFTPGHRPDHIALYIAELKILLPGDCVEEPIPLVDEDSRPDSRTFSELIESLELMRELEPQQVLANHAAPSHGNELLDKNLGYLETLRSRATSLASLAELERDCPAGPGWDDFYVKAHRATLKFAWQQFGGQR